MASMSGSGVCFEVSFYVKYRRYPIFRITPEFRNPTFYGRFFIKGHNFDLRYSVLLHLQYTGSGIFYQIKRYEFTIPEKEGKKYGKLLIINEIY